VASSRSSRRGDKEPREAAAAEKEPPAEGARDTVTAPERDADEKKVLEDRLLRLQADFENFRKRVEREKAEISRRALEEFLLELLTVLDHFELGLSAAEQHRVQDSILEGFRRVHQQLMRLLEKYGVRPIESVGRNFDPRIHEAVAHIPSEEHPENVIVAETRKGYTIGDRLLREARVVVSAGPPQEEKQEDSGAEE